jgi:hypothetical protein
MLYLLIAGAVFILSSFLLYATTHNKYIGKTAAEKGIMKAQYLRAMFGVSLFFTVIVMLLIKAFRG